MPYADELLANLVSSFPATPRTSRPRDSDTCSITPKLQWMR